MPPDNMAVPGASDEVLIALKRIECIRGHLANAANAGALPPANADTASREAAVTLRPWTREDASAVFVEFRKVNTGDAHVDMIKALHAVCPNGIPVIATKED